MMKAILESNAKIGLTQKEMSVLKETSGSVSRLIKEALEQGLIKPFDSNTAPRYMSYIPGWA